MVYSKVQENYSIEVCRGEVINHKSKVWINWWCQPKPVWNSTSEWEWTFSLTVPAIAASSRLLPKAGGLAAKQRQQYWRQKCHCVSALGSFFCFCYHKVFFIHKTTPHFQNHNGCKQSNDHTWKKLILLYCRVKLQCENICVNQKIELAIRITSSLLCLWRTQV